MIFAYSPPFTDEVSFTLSNIQGALPFSFSYIFRSIEEGYVLTNDLFCRVAFDGFRTRVPTDDVPSAIQHDNRIIFDATDEQPEALLASFQRLLRPYALSNIVIDRYYGK